tara:strand:- start:4610 stop:6634 length:2025 start_codon:yes stop_codon:yes gene_type:complete
MATVIKILRSSGVAAPANLGQGQMAYTFGTGTQSNLGDRLFIGTGTEDGSGHAANVEVIGGKYFADLANHVGGTLTASSAVITDSNNAIDQLLVGNNASAGGGIKFNEATNNGAHSVLLKAPASLSGNISLTLPATAGSNGHFMKVDGSGNLSFASVPSGAFTIAADAGSNDNFTTGETLTFAGGEGITTTVSDNQISIAAEDATETNKGIATFDGTDFTVSSGDVTVNAERIQDIAGAMFSSNTETLITATYQDGDGTVDLVVDSDLANYNNSTSAFIKANTSDTLTNKVINGSQIVDGSLSSDKLTGSVANAKLANDGVTIGSTDVSLGDTITALAAMTQIAVDNLTINGNSIASTDSNGNITLDPNGSGTVDVNSSKITSVSLPTAATDAATKAYVDSVANGLDVKASVRYATTANVAGTYNNGAGTITAGSNGAFSIDGQTPTAGDRILIKNQTTTTTNGVYTVTTVGSGSAAYVLTRTPDADAASEITGGAFVFVEEGTANADNGYVFTHNGSPTLGTDAITLAQFSGAGQITGGDAITKTGNSLAVAVDDASIEINSDAIRVKASGITNDMLAGSIAEGKLAGSISNGKLANSTITVTDGSNSTAAALGSTITFTQGEGMTVSESSGTITIAAELASASNKGVASFAAADFTVTSGVVTATGVDGGTF